MTDAGAAAYNFQKSDGTFGHRIMKIETVHGDISRHDSYRSRS